MMKLKSFRQARNANIALLFVVLSTCLGYAVQEETGVCLPEIHADLPCHCLDMGGYMNCDPKTGHYSYSEWVKRNNEREIENAGKKKKDQQKLVPMCRMSCKEDHCECCAYMERFKDKRKAQLAIPYDN